MDESKFDKSRFTCRFWLAVEILALISFSTYTAQKLYRGTKFSEGAIIFTVCILLVSVLTISVTILCYVLYQQKLHIVTMERNKEFDATPLIKRVSEDTDSVCAVCLGPRESYRIPVVSLTCQHKYHDECIRQSLQQQEKLTCPLCRSQPLKFPAPIRLLALTKTTISDQLQKLQKV